MTQPEDQLSVALLPAAQGRDCPPEAAAAIGATLSVAAFAEMLRKAYDKFLTPQFAQTLARFFRRQISSTTPVPRYGPTGRAIPGLGYGPLGFEPGISALEQAKAKLTIHLLKTKHLTPAGLREFCGIWRSAGIVQEFSEHFCGKEKSRLGSGWPGNRDFKSE